MKMKYFFAFICWSLTLPLYAEEESSGMFFSFLPEWLDIGLSLVAIILVPVGVIVLFVGMWRKSVEEEIEREVGVLP